MKRITNFLLSTTKSTKLFKNREEFYHFTISFIIASIFFLWQRKFFSWDFSTYLMNAEYFLGYGNYYELLRPPLASIVMMPFRLINRTFAIYGFVIFVTVLYFISLKLFHDRFLKHLENSSIFYFLSINPFILIWGQGVGSELLSFSLIILFITFAFSTHGYIFLSLSMLTRYSNLPLLLMIFLSKNFKKIFYGLLILFLIFLPWLIFNYLYSGHALESIGDYYALNSLEQPPPRFDLVKLFITILKMSNIGLLFLLLGLFNLKKNGNRQLYPLFIILSLSTILLYLINSLKLDRFLFNLSLPTVYFSAIGFESFMTYLRKNTGPAMPKKFRNITIFLLILSSLYSFTFMENAGKSIILKEKMVDEISARLDNCTISSDRWVYFNFKGKLASPPPWKHVEIKTGKPQIFRMVDEGYNIILFKDSESYRANENFIKKLKKNYLIEENDKYVWLRNKNECRVDKRIESRYLETLKSFGFYPENFHGCGALMLRLNLREICHIFKFL